MEFAFSQPKMVQWPQKEKLTYRLNSRPWMCPSDFTLAMTLTLNFQGQIYNLLYLCQKWLDCQEIKGKHTFCTLGLKCDHEIWPWPWPSIFKFKYELCHISTKIGLIAMKWKANILIEFLASNAIIGFDLGHYVDLGFSHQIFKQPYLKNRRANWHWTKGDHSWPWLYPFDDQDEV